MFDKQRFNLMSISASGRGLWSVQRAQQLYRAATSSDVALYTYPLVVAACILALRCVLANCVHRPSAGTMHRDCSRYTLPDKIEARPREDRQQRHGYLSVIPLPLVKRKFHPWNIRRSSMISCDPFDNVFG